VNLSVKLDQAAIHALAPGDIPRTPKSLWRFRALLPPLPAEPVTLGEGGTPLLHLQRLGARLGLSRLHGKDESRNPTWSYKDRLCALAVSHARALGARVITISSTGNHGAASAAFAARAGLPCVAFTLASVPETMKILMQAYGAAVIACDTSEARWTLMREGIERFGWYPTSGYTVPPVGSPPFGIEGYKTIAYEIAEDLDWMAPDVVIVPSSYSDGVAGIWKGFRELQALGWTKSVPRMVAAEPLGPLANALAKGLDIPEVVRGGPSVAFSIASPYGTYQGLAALRGSGGAAERITDESTLEAQRMLAADEGLFIEPSSSAALGALLQLVKRKSIEPDALIVVMLTSGGLKDPGATGAWLPEVPRARGGFDDVLRTIQESYGLDVGALS
jgi:threonine synthase